MKVTYIGMYADDGVEAEGLWFPGHTPTDVTAELAAGLLAQPANWEPADDEARALLAPPAASGSATVPDGIETGNLDVVPAAPLVPPAAPVDTAAAAPPVVEAPATVVAPPATEGAAPATVETPPAVVDPPAVPVVAEAPAVTPPAPTV